VVARSLVIVLTAAVVMTGYALVSRGSSPASPARVSEVAHGRLEVAALNVETWQRVNDTFVGAPTGLANVVLARADADTYCLQDNGLHLDGPGGTIAIGPCS
jgi:hypothetical protein